MESPYLSQKFRYSCIAAIVLVLTANLFISCNGGTQTKSSVTKKRQLILVKKAGSDSLITMRCAILIYPTLQQIEGMKKSAKDSDEFYVGADDYQFYMGTAIAYLDSVKTKTITKSAKGKLAFATNTGKIYRSKLDGLTWGIILFNGKDKPVQADITAFEDDYKSYMKE